MICVEELIEKLQLDLTRRTYSFAEYITMSSPYIPAGQEPMWNHVVELAKEEKANARQLGRLIIALGGVPTPGLFDEGAADTNYLSIGYLYGLLVKWKEDSLRQLEARVEESSGYPQVREVLLKIVEQERRQCEDLRDAIDRYGAGGNTKGSSSGQGGARADANSLSDN